ncbi:MAG TPA: lipopolysaccharide transport periplasmic protein LptA [Lysobacter sp.]
MKGLPANAVALLIALALVPHGAHARSSDRRQPMDIDAGHTSHSLDANGTAVLSGGVTITQGTLDIRAARAEITQRNGDPVRVVLTGSPVRLTQQLDDGTPMSATGNRVDYDLTTEIVVFTGGVNIQQPRGSLSGGRVVYNMRSGQVQSGGGENGGRVKMRILPRSAQGGG